jgi:hypothetical protein
MMPPCGSAGGLTVWRHRKPHTSLYGKCWGIECGLRDTKDSRFGMGLGSIHVSTPERRDRLWLLNAFAIALLTLLGAAGEALGYDRYLKSNTTKRRTHSLFRQGCMLYELIPTMPEVRLHPLIERFAVCSPNTQSLPTLSGPSENEGSHEVTQRSPAPIIRRAVKRFRFGCAARDD